MELDASHDVLSLSMHDETPVAQILQSLLEKGETWDMATGQALLAPPSFAVPFLL